MFPQRTSPHSRQPKKVTQAKHSEVRYPAIYTLEASEQLLNQLQKPTICPGHLGPYLPVRVALFALMPSTVEGTKRLPSVSQAQLKSISV